MLNRERHMAPLIYPSQQQVKEMHTQTSPATTDALMAFQDNHILLSLASLLGSLPHLSPLPLEPPHSLLLPLRPHRRLPFLLSHLNLDVSQGILKAAVSDNGKVVVIAYGLGLWFLAFCRIGDDVYTHIDIELAVVDVIYHKGNFYLFTGHESLYLLHIEEEEDGSSPHIEKLTVDLEDDFKIPNRIVGYLVPDVLTDSMFVITRDVDRIGEGNDSDEEEGLPHKTTHFDIFEVSLEESKTLKRFKKVENLGDRVLFLGHNSPIVVMASQFQGFKGNRIYFADNTENYYDSAHGCRDLGVFSHEDGTVEELFADRFHPTLSPPLWIATPPYSSSQIFEESSYAYEVST